MDAQNEQHAPDYRLTVEAPVGTIARWEHRAAREGFTLLDWIRVTLDAMSDGDDCGPILPS